MKLSTTAEREPVETSKTLQTDVMRQIVQRMALRSSGLKSQMNVQLKPPPPPPPPP